MLARALVILCLASLPAQAETLGPQLSGDARMGLVWSERDDRFGPRESGIRMTNRARLKFQFTGETTGGVRFGAELDLNRSDVRRPLRSVHIGGQP